jgi:hypothetical protein
MGLGGIGVGFERRASGRPWSGGLDKMGFGIHSNATRWPGPPASPVHLVRFKRAEVVVLHHSVDTL